MISEPGMLVVVAANASMVSLVTGYLLSEIMDPPALPEILSILPG
jgi:hypothetical protein